MLCILFCCTCVVRDLDFDVLRKILCIGTLVLVHYVLVPYFPDYKSRFFTKIRDREKRGATYIRDICDLHSRFS